MTESRIKAKVGGITLTVPIVRDEKTTRLFIQQVNDRLAQIEVESQRVDTQAFALQAAVALAAELQAERDDRAADAREFVKALAQLQSSLKTLTEQAQKLV